MENNIPCPYCKSHQRAEQTYCSDCGINKEFKVFQGDEFSPPFVVKTFKTKKEADDFVDEIQKESSKHDEYTAFWVK